MYILIKIHVDVLKGCPFRVVSLYTNIHWDQKFSPYTIQPEILSGTKIRQLSGIIAKILADLLCVVVVHTYVSKKWLQRRTAKFDSLPNLPALL